MKAMMPWPWHSTQILRKFYANSLNLQLSSSTVFFEDKFARKKGPLAVATIPASSKNLIKLVMPLICIRSKGKNLKAAGKQTRKRRLSGLGNIYSLWWKVLYFAKI